MKISKWEETLPIGVGLGSDATVNDENVERMAHLYEEELVKLLPKRVNIDISNGDVYKLYITDTYGNIYRITENYSELPNYPINESQNVDEISRTAWSNALDRLCQKQEEKST